MSDCTKYVTVCAIFLNDTVTVNEKVILYSANSKLEHVQHCTVLHHSQCHDDNHILVLFSIHYFLIILYICIYYNYISGILFAIQTHCS